MLERFADMMAAAVRWLAQQAGSAASSLLGVAEAVAEVLAKLMRMLWDAIKALGTSGPGIAIVVEVRLDARSYALRQIVITPAWVNAPGGNFSGQELGLSIDIPLDWQPMLLVELDGSPSVALMAVPPVGSLATLGTDLWLSRDAGVEAVRDTDPDGKRADKRLIQATAKFNTTTAIAVIRLSGGKAQFMQACKATVQATPIMPPAGTSLPAGLMVARMTGAITYSPLDWASVDVNIEAQTDRLLPFLQSSKQSTPKFVDALGQYIQVTAKKSAVPVGNGAFDLPISVTLKIKDANVDFDLNVHIDLTNFSVRLSGGDKVRIFGEASKSDFSLLGLNGNIVLNAPEAPIGLPANFRSSGWISRAATCASHWLLRRGSTLPTARWPAAAAASCFMSMSSECRAAGSTWRPRSTVTLRCNSPASTCRSASMAAGSRSRTAKSRHFRSKAPGNCLLNWSAKPTPRFPSRWEGEATAR
ncbi:hypothetical protein ACQ5SK_26715 [Bradyrhizobium japonicum]